MKLLEIRNLHASVCGREILKGINFSVGEGEVHAIMGPNGSGKSTLASVLAGNPRFEVTDGEVRFYPNCSTWNNHDATLCVSGDYGSEKALGRGLSSEDSTTHTDSRGNQEGVKNAPDHGKPVDLLALPIEDRARAGIFLGFQYPVEIPGVSMANFMKAAVAERRKAQGLEPLSAAEFLRLTREKAAIVELDPAMISRSVNEGFSGGEKKKNEIFQMAMLSPRLAVLDETDSGLDIDALRVVGEGVSKLRRPDNAIVLITHYQRLLDYIVPDFVHVLYRGRIIESGGRDLALKLEADGYDWLINR